MNLFDIFESTETYVLYFDGKPVATYDSVYDAEFQARLVKKNIPNLKFEIKKEVCSYQPVQLKENLRDWFKDKWVRFGPDGKIRGDCARGSNSEGKPKCLPQSKAHSLGKKGRASAAARKRREDPNPERSGKAINVNTKKKSNESLREFAPMGSGDNGDDGFDDNALKILAAQWWNGDEDPKVEKTLAAAGWEIGQDEGYDNGGVFVVRAGDVNGNSYMSWPAEELTALSEACWKGYHKEGMKTMFGKRYPNCVKNTNEEQTVKEDTNIPFNTCPGCGGDIVHESELQEKQDACYHKVKSRYKVWPSAYASGALVQCRKKGAKNWGTKSEGVMEAPVEWHNTETGVKDAAQTDHTMDEALEYLKTNYPVVKMYNVRRAAMGLTALDQPKYVDTGNEADINKNIIRKSAAHMSGVDSAVDYLQLRKNTMMSGSQQVTLTIGYSWSVYENPNSGIAMLYYQDRGMAWDEIYLAGKTPKIQAQARQVFRDAGVIPTPMKKPKQQGMAEGLLNEFAPGSGGGDGRWYTDDEIADIIGEDWLEFDLSGEAANISIHGEHAKILLVQEAQAYFEDRGYHGVIVQDVRDDEDYLAWYIIGNFTRSDEGVAEGIFDFKKQPMPEHGDELKIGDRYVIFDDGGSHYGVSWIKKDRSEAYEEFNKSEYTNLNELKKAIWDEIKYQDQRGMAETSDYFRRREREEEIISGKKPARKKQPAQISDYAKRREQEKNQGMAEDLTDDLDNIYAMHPQPEKSEQVVFLITGMTEDEFSNLWADLPNPYQQEFGYDLPLWDADDLSSYPNLAVKRITFDQYVRLVGNYIKSEELAGSAMSKMKKGVAEGSLEEKWSQKYKSSINCSNPKGFSQKAHCAGKNKNESKEYYNVVGTDGPTLRNYFNMSRDQFGWFLKEGATPKQKIEVLRAFGSPKLKEYDLAAHTGGTQTKGDDNVISPVGSKAIITRT